MRWLRFITDADIESITDTHPDIESVTDTVAYARTGSYAYTDSWSAQLRGAGNRLKHLLYHSRIGDDHGGRGRHLVCHL